MKILVCGDVHWSEYSSIVRSVTDRHSTRLENLIKSVNWALDLSIDKKCDMICFLGDFFDKDTLNSKEITALNDLCTERVNIPTRFITGNHEMGSHDLFYNSCNIFNSFSNFECINEPIKTEVSNIEICYLPYILENNKKSIEEYFGAKSNKKRIIFSHNDIAGIQMGAWKSTSGFSIEEIEDNCDLFINGHLHNGASITEKIVNLGNLTGQNFSEDASIYSHRIAIIDTDNMGIEYVENPYAMNFYKIDATDIYTSFSRIKLKPNAVVSISCIEDNFEEAKKFVDRNNIINSRITVSQIYNDVEVELSNDLNLMSDHLQKFKDFVLDKFGSSEIILDELNRIIS